MNIKKFIFTKMFFMKKCYALLFIIFTLTYCASKSPKILGTTTNPTENSSNHQPFDNISKYSKNKKYGLSGKYPVKVGKQSAQNQRRYLSSLAGPNGEQLEFHRRGSCCPYESENAIFGRALVDVYEVSYEGLKEPVLIYISLYDYEPLFIPVGFTMREE